MVLHALQNRVNFFEQNKQTRESVRWILTQLSNDKAYSITQLLQKKLPTTPKWFWWLQVDIAIVFLVIIGSFFNKGLLLFLLIPLFVNIALHYWNKSNSYIFSTSLSQFKILIKVSKQLLQLQLPIDNLEVVESLKKLQKFRTKSAILNFGDPTQLNDFEALLYYTTNFIKSFFLVELFTFYSLINELQNKQSYINKLFSFVGSLDVAISIASLKINKTTCLPQFIEPSKQLVATNCYHPLIINCTTNSIQVNNKSVLITGSNMAGKTTFLRTILINSILAQTLHICFANEMQLPIVKQFSSIKINDNLLNNASYFFEEVNSMSLLVDATLLHQNLFVLDEVFKGTNTVERIAAAKSILSYLNKQNNIVFVSTHDIELANLLDNCYNLYHFNETIHNNTLSFDYTIKPGKITTRNAIKILEISRFPKEIIDEANSLLIVE
jgi:MutS domain V